MSKTTTCQTCKKYDNAADVCTLEPFEGQYTAGCPEIDRTVGGKIGIAIVLLVITGVLWILHPILGIIAFILTVLVLATESKIVATIAKVVAVVAVVILIGAFIFAGDAPESDMQSAVIGDIDRRQESQSSYHTVSFEDGTQMVAANHAKAGEIRKEIQQRVGLTTPSGLVKVTHDDKSWYFVWYNLMGTKCVWHNMKSDTTTIMTDEQFARYFTNVTYFSSPGYDGEIADKWHKDKWAID